MNQRSNVGTSLNKKRHISLAKKIGAYFIFVLFFISLGVLGLTKEQAQIKDVIVSGNSSISTEDITNIINNEMDKNYLWIIETNNILLLRRGEIEKQILDNYKKIGKVSILMRGIDKIEIAVTERESKNLWCKGTPIAAGECYFMDSSGYIFEDAPTFSEGTFPQYFGLITERDPIGQFYFKNNFKDISSLYNTFEKMSFPPKYFNAVNEHEYEVYLSGNGKILINDEKSFESSLTNLQALVDNNYIKNDADSLKKINYIDLRFGNKVNFELNK